jgi:ABC-type multidrug transport system fused ATPase/permease subunit
MTSWLDLLKRGLKRNLAVDRLLPASDQPAAGQPTANRRAAYLRLKPFLLDHWKTGAVGMMLVLAGFLFGLPQPLVYRYLVDQVVLAKQLHLLAAVLVGLIGLKGLGMLANTAQSLYFNRFEQEVILEIQQDLFERVLRFPKAFFDHQETGYLMERVLGDVQGLRWYFSSVLVSILTSVLRFVSGVVMIFVLEWRLSLVILLVLPLLLLVVRFFAQRLYALSQVSMEQQAEVSRSAQETLSASALIKSFASEGQALSQITNKLRTVQQTALEQVVVNSAASLMISLAPAIAQGLSLILGAYWIITGDWTLGSLLAFQAYLATMFGPAQYLATANLQLQSAQAALDRVSALYEIVPEESAGTGIPVESLSGEVELKEVSFSYNGTDWVLENISLHVRPGQWSAIIGPSGVGKTTLTSLLLGFYRPSQGEILFDGRPAAEYDLSSLRKRIGYVSQSPLLLNDTILENLRYADPEASPKQVEGAAKAAGIHEFITSLPAGYDTLVGERGVRLSEGQKQRLALARALVKEADILILDEPTSALDRQVEHAIFDLRTELFQSKTVFLVSHNPETIQQADQAYLLHGKRLVASGSPAQVAENPLYRKVILGE